MYAIYGNIYHQYTPNVSINIPAPWILWGKNIDGSLTTDNHADFSPPHKLGYGAYLSRPGFMQILL